jgi:hypothetical protein
MQGPQVFALCAVFVSAVALGVIVYLYVIKPLAWPDDENGEPPPRITRGKAYPSPGSRATLQLNG